MSEAEEERAKLIAAYRATFSTEDGRRVLMDLAYRHGLFGATDLILQADGATNALRAARREGERSVVLGIMSRMNATATDAISLYEEMGDVSIRVRGGDPDDQEPDGWFDG